MGFEIFTRIRLVIIALALTLGIFSLEPAQAQRIPFTYNSSAALKADGWDFIARTASGGTRNTERTTGRVVDYNQTVHPGTIRIPADSGTLRGGSNNSRNTLFRNLPSDWTTIRLRVASFAPTASRQGACLAAYQNDSTYVSICRDYVNSQVVEWWQETLGIVSTVSSQANSAMTNVLLRLDRNPTTNTLTAFISVNSGGSWTQLSGSVTKGLSNPRVAVVVGGNNSTTSFPAADLAFVDIGSVSSPLPPILAVTPESLNFSGIAGGTNPAGQSVSITNTGSGSLNWTATDNQGWLSISPGSGSAPSTLSVSVSTAGLSAGTYTGTITVNAPGAGNSPQGIPVTLTLTASVPAPTVSSVSPNSGSQGQTLSSVVIAGTNFQNGATCKFGSGVTVNSCTFNSNTKLTASVTIGSSATVGARTVQVTNPDTQTASLLNGFTVTAGTQTSVTLTVAVLVNSANLTGYNPAPTSPGEFQRYPQLYLDHLQVPYEIFDTSTLQPPVDLGARQLIVSGHSGLNLSPAWQNAIVTAVNGGSGFVNLDAAATIGSQGHIQSLFGAAGSTLGTPATSLSVPAAVLPDGVTPHFIAAWQRRFLGDPLGDITYTFHADSNGVVQAVAPTVLTNAVGTVIARVGSAPLILARDTGAGRVVHFGSYAYLKADRFGFVQGVDDLFWRSLVWAARKPFLLRGSPRYWAVQMDDTMSGWSARVKDLYDSSLTGDANAAGAGGPWKVTGYLFTDNFPAGSSERASVIADVRAGKLQVVPHSFANITYGNMYWNASSGPLTDAHWLANLDAITAWKVGNGGTDVIPSFSRALVAHYWDLSNNTGYDLWHTLGFRYITSVQKPGFQRPDSPQTVNIYNGAERLHAPDFWLYEQPPKLAPSESTPFFFVGDYPVGSRSGFPPQTFFLFATQYIDLQKYPRNDFIWPSATNSSTVASSLDHLQRYTWRHWSGLSPVQLFTHDIVNYEYATVGDRRAVITQASTWLRDNGARPLFMENLGDYLYARDKSVLAEATQTTTGIQVKFDGDAATADGVPVETTLLVFYPDKEGVPVRIPGFTGGTTMTVPLPVPPPTITAVSPGSGASSGGTSVTISGTNFVDVREVRFGTVVASFTVNSSTQVTATTPPGAGVVDVTVLTTSGSATVPGGFTYVTPPPAAGHFDFVYANRTALFAGGWNFLAKTATGATRDTEQTGSLAVNYDQTLHPGTIRLPVSSGEIWQGQNNSQNMLLRDLPADWTSLRLKIAAFNPVANYQQVGLLAYQDDDRYVGVRRNYNDTAGGASIGTVQEAGGVGAVLERRPLSNTGNLILRLDRNLTNNAYTPYYSVDGGSSWVQLVGIPAQTLSNARLAIQVGANIAGTPPTADLAWVEVLR